MDNKKEFKELVLKYESMPLKDIEEVFNRSESSTVAEKLTGYGSFTDCPLCTVVNRECSECQWYTLTGSRCTAGANAETYKAIGKSFNPEKLKKSFKARAKYMRSIWKKGE